jgi:hypothetical protein
MISSAVWKTLLGFHRYHKPGGGDYLTLTTNKRVGPFCSIGVGSFYVVKRRPRRYKKMQRYLQ